MQKEVIFAYDSTEPLDVEGGITAALLGRNTATALWVLKIENPIGYPPIFVVPKKSSDIRLFL